MDEAQRQEYITRIGEWLNEYDMALDDVGVDVPFEDLTDELIHEILDNIADDEARKAHRIYSKGFIGDCYE
jgi:hypothetical protein